MVARLLTGRVSGAPLVMDLGEEGHAGARPPPRLMSGCTVCSGVSDSETPWTVAHQAQDFPGKNTGVGCHFLFQGAHYLKH